MNVYILVVSDGELDEIMGATTDIDKAQAWQDEYNRKWMLTQASIVTKELDSLPSL